MALRPTLSEWFALFKLFSYRPRLNKTLGAGVLGPGSRLAPDYRTLDPVLLCPLRRGAVVRLDPVGFTAGEGIDGGNGQLGPAFVLGTPAILFP